MLEAVPFLSARLHDLRFWRILLKGLELVSYMEGEWLIREGETSEYFFMMKKGQCELISERFEGQGLDEDGRPRNQSPGVTQILKSDGQPALPEWELLDWEEEERRARDEADGVGVNLSIASPDPNSSGVADDTSIPVFSPHSPGGDLKHRPAPLDLEHFGRVGSKPGRPHEISFDDSRPAPQGGNELDEHGQAFAGGSMSNEAGNMGWAGGMRSQEAGGPPFSEAPEHGPQGPDPRQASPAGYGWKGEGARPWWSPLALGRGTLSSWGRDKSIVPLDSRGNTPQTKTGRSFWRPFSTGSPASRRSAQPNPQSPPDGASIAGRSMAGDNSLYSMPLTDSTGGTWAVPRPAFLNRVGLSSLSAYFRTPDFGPPPDWLPVSLHAYWPTGGVRGRGFGAGMGWGGANPGMSMVSDTDISATRSLSGTMSPTRSIVSLSGVSGHGRTHHFQAQAANTPDEPPYVYGKFNMNAFFGDVAMSFGWVSGAQACCILWCPSRVLPGCVTARAHCRPPC